MKRIFEKLGMGNQHFNNPNHEVKSTKATFGGELGNIFSDQLQVNVGKRLITKYSELDTYKQKPKGQSQVPQSELGNDDYQTTNMSMSISTGQKMFLKDELEI